MPVTEHKPLKEQELAAGLVLLTKALFAQFFFKDEYSLEPSLEQKLMLCDESEKVLFCTGRKLSKTVVLEATVLQDLTTNINEFGGVDEALFYTPSEVHLMPFVERVFSRIDREPFFKSIIRDKRRGDNTFVESHLGLRYYMRIEGTSGTDRNVVGLRAKMIRGDEQAFGSWAVYNSLIQTALPGCKWILAGVPNGVRDTPFYELDQTPRGASWSRHKYSTFINPIYQSEGQKQALVEAYGGENTQGYITQVLGLWGEELVSSFPPGSISNRNHPYFLRLDVSIRSELESLESVIALRVGIPSVRCNKFVLGWDYGYSPDPSVLGGAFCQEDESEWQVYFRLVMRRVPLPYQILVVQHCIQRVFNGTFVGLSSDKHDAIQLLHHNNPDHSHLYLWSNPGGSTPVILKPEDELLENSGRRVTRLPGELKQVNVPNKELYTGWLKSWMINAVQGLFGRRLWIGEDPEVVGELISTTERKSGGRTLYYSQAEPGNSKMVKDHNRDALTYLCHAIDVGLRSEGQAMSEHELLSVMGWAGDANGSWSAPWDSNANKRE